MVQKVQTAEGLQPATSRVSENFQAKTVKQKFWIKRHVYNNTTIASNFVIEQLITFG